MIHFLLQVFSSAMRNHSALDLVVVNSEKFKIFFKQGLYSYFKIIIIIIIIIKTNTHFGTKERNL